MSEVIEISNKISEYVTQESSILIKLDQATIWTKDIKYIE